MSQDNTKLCDFINTNNNDFLGTPIAPLTDAKSCEINAALLNHVMKDQFSGLLIRLQPIYNFLLFHTIILSVLGV